MFRPVRFFKTLQVFCFTITEPSPDSSGKPADDLCPGLCGGLAANSGLRI